MINYYRINNKLNFKMQPSLKIIYTLEQRKIISGNTILKHPNKIPLILFTDNKTSPPDKEKFIISREAQIAAVLYKLRKYIEISPYDALFFMTYNNGKTKLLNLNDNIDSIYNNNKDEDGFLYIVYSTEQTFG